MSNNKPTEQGVPEWLATGAEGMENIEDSFKPDELAVATSMTGAFTEGDVELKHIFNKTTNEDLGPKRQMAIVKYDQRFSCLNSDQNRIICKSYDKSKGLVRVYQSDDIDHEFVETMNLTDEELAEDGLVERSCEECPHHPINGWSVNENGDNIPPRCHVVNELIVLDLTDGFNKAPYMLRIPKNSSLKKDVIDGLNNLIKSKLRLQNIPLWGGVFDVYGKQVQNSRGGKNVVLGFDFNDYIKNKEVFDYCQQLYKQLVESEEARRAKEEQRAKEETGDVETSMDEADPGESAFDVGGGDDADEVWPEE